DDELFHKSLTKTGQVKMTSGVIKSESPRGVKLDTKDIPIDDIRDIFYEIPPKLRVTIYQTAFDAEKDANDPAKEKDRAANLAKALQSYEKTRAGLPAGAKLALPRRHLEFKVAYLRGLQAQEEGKAPQVAILKLNEFKTKHANGWQISAALLLLARLREEAGE